MVFQVPRDSVVAQEHQELRVPLVSVAPQGHQVLRDSLVSVVPQEHLEHRVPRVPKVSPEPLEPQVVREFPALRERQAQVELAQREQQDLLDLPALQETKVSPEPQGHQVPQEHQAHRASVVPQAREAIQVQRPSFSGLLWVLVAHLPGQLTRPMASAWFRQPQMLAPVTQLHMLQILLYGWLVFLRMAITPMMGERGQH